MKPVLITECEFKNIFSKHIDLFWGCTLIIKKLIRDFPDVNICRKWQFIICGLAKKFIRFLP